MVAKENRGRGRPLGFSPEEALALGQCLFHAHGYNAVGLAALTEQLGIAPASFYGVFGSKLNFYEKVLARYAATTLALDEVLRPGRPPAEALSELLEQAARTYTTGSDAKGCLVLECARGNGGEDSVRIARSAAERRRKILRHFVAATHPDSAEAVADFMSSAMSGLSASAREGMDEGRVVAIARAAAAALPPLLESRPN